MEKSSKMEAGTNFLNLTVFKGSGGDKEFLDALVVVLHNTLKLSEIICKYILSSITGGEIQKYSY